METCARVNNSVLLVDPSVSGDALETDLIAINRLAGRVTNKLDAIAFVRDHQPAWALIELRLGSECGLDLLEEICHAGVGTRTVIATMYGTIGAACAAVSRGAVGFFAKPVTLNQIMTGICKQSKEGAAVVQEMQPWLTVNDMRGRYIQEVVAQCGSLAQAAKALHVDRRSLRRMMNRLHLRR